MVGPPHLYYHENDGTIARLALRFGMLAGDVAGIERQIAAGTAEHDGLRDSHVDLDA